MEIIFTTREGLDEVMADLYNMSNIVINGEDAEEYTDEQLVRAYDRRDCVDIDGNFDTTFALVLHDAVIYPEYQSDGALMLVVRSTTGVLLGGVDVSDDERVIPHILREVLAGNTRGALDDYNDDDDDEG